VVSTYIPAQRFAYELTAERRTSVAWTIQRAASGTRLIYEESFLADDAGDGELVAKVREIVGKWLLNIKRYAELPSSRSGRVFRWAADRFYLRLRPDQRNVVAALVGLQAISTIGFVMAAIGIGLGSLIF
jgi:hypothetical protein